MTGKVEQVEEVEGHREQTKEAQVEALGVLGQAEEAKGVIVAPVRLNTAALTK